MFLIVALALMSVFMATEALPRFAGLVSVDLSSLEYGFSNKGGRGCEVVGNALSEDLSAFPDEEAIIRFRHCNWV